jgi:hypothetical protein
MTPSGIEPATFRFVAQNLNHCATAVPRMATCGRIYLLPKTTSNVQSDIHVYCELYCKHSGVVNIYMKLTNYEDHLKVLFIIESEVMSAKWRASVGLHSQFQLKSRVYS